MKLFFLSIIIPLQAFSQFQTIGPNSCGLGQANCHAYENNWWLKDAHFSTTDKFYAATPSVKKVAAAYGLSMDKTYSGNSKCMTCHGTVISGKEAESIDIGVSCESCHGAGSGYKEVHAEGKPEMGKLRSGYLKGLQAGMVENGTFETRAKTCTKCHNITDVRLVAAGHPDGKDFDYIRGLRKVSAHWKHDLEDAGQLRMAFASVLSGAPVPVIARRPPAKIDSAAVVATAPSTISRAPIVQPKPASPQAQVAIPSTTHPALRPAIPERVNKPKTLPPFPMIPDSLSDYQKAMLIKIHIDMLLRWYQKN